MNLKDKMLSEIRSKIVVGNPGTGDVLAAEACAKIIQQMILEAKIVENYSIYLMAKLHMDERAQLVLTSRLCDLLLEIKTFMDDKSYKTLLDRIKLD